MALSTQLHVFHVLHLNTFLYVKAVLAAFNKKKALEMQLSEIATLRMFVASSIRHPGTAAEVRRGRPIFSETVDIV